jgi:digeranylgeranylglycerophospholipid reductase
MPCLSAGGLVLAGDAGRLTDPLTGEGILNGMISGRIAGDVIAACIANGDVSAGALQRYDREIGRELGPVLDRNYRLKEFIRRAGDAKLDWTFRALKATGAESVPAAELLKKMYSPGSSHISGLMRLFL